MKLILWKKAIMNSQLKKKEENFFTPNERHFAGVNRKNFHSILNLNYLKSERENKQ